MPTTLKFFRRNLPHWLVADRSYFVTIRLHGTLPKEVIDQLQEERRRADADGATLEETEALRRRQFKRLENILDSIDEGKQRHWLAESRVATMVLENLAWFGGKRGWRIYAAVIMSTHLHMLMRNEKGRSADLLQDLAHYKRYTAERANGTLGRKGPFWAREGFDHWIRDRAKFEGTVRYILNNPVKAGLVQDWRDWPWYWLDDTIRELI